MGSSKESIRVKFQQDTLRDATFHITSATNLLQVHSATLTCNPNPHIAPPSIVTLYLILKLRIYCVFLDVYLYYHDHMSSLCVYVL